MQGRRNSENQEYIMEKSDSLDDLQISQGGIGSDRVYLWHIFDLFDNSNCNPNQQYTNNIANQNLNTNTNTNCQNKQSDNEQVSNNSSYSSSPSHSSQHSSTKIRGNIQNNINCSWSTQQLNVNHTISQISSTQLPAQHQSSSYDSDHDYQQHEYANAHRLLQLFSDEAQSYYLEHEEIQQNILRESTESKYVEMLKNIEEEIRYKRSVLKQYQDVYRIVQKYLLDKQKYGDGNSKYSMVQNRKYVFEPESKNYCGFKNYNELVLAQILAYEGYINPQSLTMMPKTSNKLTQIIKEARINYLKNSNHDLETYRDEGSFLKDSSTSHHSKEEGKPQIIQPHKSLTGDRNQQQNLEQQEQQLSHKQNSSLTYSKNYGQAYQNQQSQQISQIELQLSNMKDSINEYCRQKCESFGKLEIDLSVSSQQLSQKNKSLSNCVQTKFFKNSVRNQDQSKNQSRQSDKSNQISQQSCRLYGIAPWKQQQPRKNGKMHHRTTYYGIYQQRLRNILKNKYQQQNSMVKIDRKKGINENMTTRRAKQSPERMKFKKYQNESLKILERNAWSNQRKRQPLEILRQHCRGPIDESSTIGLNSQFERANQSKTINRIENKVQIQRKEECKYFFQVYVGKRKDR